MADRPRPTRSEKLARLYDAEILPVWAERFGRMLLRDLALPERCQVLDVACATGYPATEVVRKMGAGSRLIAIDSSSAMIDVARRKMQDLGVKGVFFRTESADHRLPFADDVYDLVYCNLGLGELADPRRALIDFARVAKPGGQVRCTLPLEGSFQEFFDIYREVLTKHDKHDLLARLDAHVAAAYPTPAACEGWMADAGLTASRIEVERFTLLFKSSREFFFAPLIEAGPLIEWKDLAGRGQEMQDVFWYIKEAIDAYFADRAFEVSVVAACLRGVKAGAAADDDDGEIDFGEIEVDSIDIAGEEAIAARGAAAESPPTADPGLDAFVAGKPRPAHLVPMPADTGVRAPKPEPDPDADDPA